MTKELPPYRNLSFQIWNEFNERVPENVKIIKATDPQRLVSNSPSVRFIPTITSSRSVTAAQECRPPASPIPNSAHPSRRAEFITQRERYMPKP